jgi:hypothetical protein
VHGQLQQTNTRATPVRSHVGQRHGPIVKQLIRDRPGHAALKRGLSGSALVSGPVVSRGTALEALAPGCGPQRRCPKRNGPLISRTTSNQTADGSLFRVFATNEHARAFGTDRLVVRVFMVDGEDLPGSVYGSLIVLRDDEGASENEATDRERMPVLSLCRTLLQVLGFYFRVPVSSKLCLEIDLIHLIFHSASHGASVRLSAAIDQFPEFA